METSCNYDMCPHCSFVRKTCVEGLNPEEECLFPEKLKNYKLTLLDRFLDFLDDCRITAVMIWKFF